MAASPPTSLSLSLDTILSSSHRLSPSPLSFPSSPSHKPRRRHISIKSLPPSAPPTPAAPTAATFLDPVSLHRLRTLDNLNLTHRCPRGGSLQIRPMARHEVDNTVALLADSFADSMWMPSRYVMFLAFLVKQYVLERMNLMPHTVMLVGFYSEAGDEADEAEAEAAEGGAQLACTAEVSFDARGANAAPPTPVPPSNCPYICNMTVKKSLRRRGIGRQLLNACEELISQMKTIRKVYLHCRVIDTVPFEMYRKAGYKVVKTDSILIWFSLQRRKHLMCKELPPLVDSQPDTSDSEDHPF